MSIYIYICVCVREREGNTLLKFISPFIKEKHSLIVPQLHVMHLFPILNFLWFTSHSQTCNYTYFVSLPDIKCKKCVCGEQYAAAVFPGFNSTVILLCG